MAMCSAFTLCWVWNKLQSTRTSNEIEHFHLFLDEKFRKIRESNGCTRLIQNNLPLEQI